MIRFATGFSGIEAPSVATAPLGWRCVGTAEIKPFPCAVLAHHYPDVPNLGDVEADGVLDAYTALHPDVLIAGPPCQDFSVAGLRAGIHGDCGNLTFRWAEIIHAARPRFALTENVPGWLTANDGLAFGAFLAGLVGHHAPLLPPKLAGGRWTNAGMVDGPLGRAAWRILDARYFDVAQRRERVFVVWCPANGGDPAQVLLEPQGVRRNPSAGGGARQRVTGTLEARAGAGGAGWGTDWMCAGGVVEEPLPFDTTHITPPGNWSNPQHGDPCHPVTATAHVPAIAYGCNNTSGPIDVAGALNASHTASGRQDFETETFITHTLKGEGHDASEDGTGRGVPLVAFQDRFRGDDGRGYGRVPPVTEDAIGTLETVKPWNVATPMAVRRLTPIECARLQGFPDRYLDVPFRGKPAADGPKYEALGNSMAVPVIHWICSRIARQL